MMSLKKSQAHDSGLITRSFIEEIIKKEIESIEYCIRGNEYHVSLVGLDSRLVFPSKILMTDDFPEGVSREDMRLLKGWLHRGIIRMRVQSYKDIVSNNYKS